jgi:hypothetical protein
MFPLEPFSAVFGAGEELEVAFDAMKGGSKVNCSTQTRPWLAEVVRSWCTVKERHRGAARRKRL